MISNWSSQGHRESRLAMARTQMLRRSDVLFFFGGGGKGTAILLSFLLGFHRVGMRLCLSPCQLISFYFKSHVISAYINHWCIIFDIYAYLYVLWNQIHYWSISSPTRQWHRLRLRWWGKDGSDLRGKLYWSVLLPIVIPVAIVADGCCDSWWFLWSWR